MQPWSVYPTQINKSRTLARYQTSIYDPKNKRLFYFGGRYQTPPSTPFEQFTFKNVTTFDLMKGEWGIQILNGIAPTERNGHSTTLSMLLFEKINVSLHKYNNHQTFNSWT